MKRYKLLFTLTILSISLSVLGQSKFNYGLGFSAIQNFYKQTSNENVQGLFAVSRSTNARSSFSFNFRLTYEIEKENSFSVSPGIRYFKSFNDLDFSNHKATFWDLPIQLNTSLYENWYMVAGLRFSYLSSLNRDDNFNLQRKEDLLDAAENRFFYIPKLGIGTTLFTSINLEVSYNIALANLILVESSGGFTIPSTTYKSNFLQLSLIYNGLGTLFLKNENKTSN